MLDNAALHLIRELGVIPEESLQRWDGELIGIYRPDSRSKDPEAWSRRYHEILQSDEHALHIGNFETGLTSEQARWLRRELDKAGVRYLDRSVTLDWIYSKARQRIALTTG